jgi:hypothetical protein
MMIGPDFIKGMSPAKIIRITAIFETLRSGTIGCDIIR